MKKDIKKLVAATIIGSIVVMTGCNQKGMMNDNMSNNRDMQQKQQKRMQDRSMKNNGSRYSSNGSYNGGC